jgi:hypothetical protein
MPICNLLGIVDGVGGVGPGERQAAGLSVDVVISAKGDN